MHTKADGSKEGICYSNVMGICNNKGECKQGLHLSGDQLTEEQVYFALRYYGREMIVFLNKLENRKGEDELVLAFGPGFGFVENGVLSA